MVIENPPKEALPRFTFDEANGSKFLSPGLELDLNAQEDLSGW